MQTKIEVLINPVNQQIYNLEVRGNPDIFVYLNPYAPTHHKGPDGVPYRVCWLHVTLDQLQPPLPAYPIFLEKPVTNPNANTNS